MSKRRPWSKSFGERGNRVRVYEIRVGGNLARSVFIHGKEDRKSLGHKDRTLAQQQAYELIAQLVADEDAVERGSLTLGQLQHLYSKSAAFADKKARTRKEDKRRLDRVIRFLGIGRDVATLSESDVRRFTAARRAGDPVLVGVAPGVSVRDRSIEADLVALRTALNWAAMERDSSGRRLIAENPLRGVPIPREKNPVRPLVTYDEYLKLLEIAPLVHELLPLALVIAEGTGRRLSAFRQLRWSDVNLAGQTILWRAECDKMNRASEIPIADEVKQALLRAQQERPAIGNAPVFPSPGNPSKPCRAEVLDGWLRRAYVLAEVEPKRGGMWHPFRRKWATERKGMSPVDVAAAGGWKDPNTPLRIYQQADKATMRAVVSAPTHRLTSEGR